MDNSIPHQLIDQCRQNNREAQFKLYQQYCNGMFIIANRLMDNPQDAEDAIQEAFINAFQKIEQYKGEVTFGAWLKKIVINKCLDNLKSERKRKANEKVSTIDMPFVETTWQVEDTVSITEIKIAIQTLPDKYRRVIMLYLIEGYSHEEIAQILDITIITSRTRLRRGKQKLKILLKQQCYG
jgi:RNA polymerase sigma-70 factor (ECF subfamily)